VSTPSFPALLQRFFTDRLRAQLGASPHTIASYRDTFRLLLAFATERVGRAPSHIRLEDLDIALLGAFLDHLEQDRGSSIKTRNIRLTALRAFFRYVSFTEPECALQCQRALAIPTKRHERRPVEFLSEQETVALLAAPDTTTWIGRRDRTLLLVGVETGLRNTEIRTLRRADVELGSGANVRCAGKGRKTRSTPLRQNVATTLETWLDERGGGPEDAVFPSSRGGVLSPDALQRLVTRHTETASAACQSLAGRRITPHSLRHTTAMSLLRRGVDHTVIALWLGHESTQTTQIYLHADMRMKGNALAHAEPSGEARPRFQPTDDLLAFLENL